MPEETSSGIRAQRGAQPEQATRRSNRGDPTIVPQRPEDSASHREPDAAEVVNDGGDQSIRPSGAGSAGQGDAGSGSTDGGSIAAEAGHADAEQAVGDEQLLEAVRAGDESSYGVLYERHRSTALNVARMHTRNFQDAEDLISEAFARVLQIIRKGGGPRKFLRSYLVTTIGRLAVDQGVASGKVQPVGEEEQLDRPEEFDDVVVKQCEAVSAANAYTSLPERWQAVLWHTEVEGMKPRAVAGALGMTPNAVSALTKRAREGLQAAYLQAQVSSAATEHCPEVAHQLGAFVKGSLGSRARRQVQQHLDTCPRCTAEYLQLLDLGVGMRTWILPALAALSLWGTESKVLAALTVSGTGAGVAGTTRLPAPDAPAGGEGAAPEGAEAVAEGAGSAGPQAEAVVVPGAQTAGSGAAGSTAAGSGAVGAAGASAPVGVAAGGAGLGLKIAVGAVAASAAVALVGVGVNTLVQEDGANNATTLGGLPFPASGDVTVEAEPADDGAGEQTSEQTGGNQVQAPQPGGETSRGDSGSIAEAMRSIAADESFGTGMTTFDRSDRPFGQENPAGSTAQDAAEYFRAGPAQQGGSGQGGAEYSMPGTSGPSWNSGVGDPAPVIPSTDPNAPGNPTTGPVAPAEPAPTTPPSVPGTGAGTGGTTPDGGGAPSTPAPGEDTGAGGDPVTSPGDDAPAAEPESPSAEDSDTGTPQAFFRIQQPASDPVTGSESGSAAESESSEPAAEDPPAEDPPAEEPAGESVNESATQAEPAPEPTAESAPTADPEAAPVDPEPQPAPTVAPQPEPAPEPESEATTEPEAVLEPAPEPEATAVPELAPEPSVQPEPTSPPLIQPQPAEETTDSAGSSEEPGSWERAGQPTWSGGWWIWTIKGWAWHP
ncbi:sigma-70 family RNA polymerase sigma factor [Kocuria coralli]|uniref:sigma-70 family RNA polymerase sigma factor n=1 Tax=Kocuria coralli TaxID=1461025 RepID=UPI0015F2D58E|nr:sigma-70 family RNA polymerase sigma factor [Kocuria coralli]